MPESSTIESHPAARPFTLLGGPIGLLLLHGYGGSIGDYRPIAEQFHRRGLTVRGVCLPGHGRTMDDLRRASLTEWQACVYHEAMELRRHCSHVIVLGSSFGAVLALNLAALAPNSCDGLVVVNAALHYRGGGVFQPIALRILKLFTPDYAKPGLSTAERERAIAVGSMPAWPIDGILATARFARRVVRPMLPKVTAPILVITSASDPIVGAETSRTIAHHVGSKTRRIFTLTSGGHRPFRDPVASEIIVNEVLAFLKDEVALKV